MNASSAVCEPATDAAAGFVRFCDLPLFSTPQNAESLLAAPLLAHAWAATVMRFWEEGIAHGSIDPGEPLYLLGPAPGRGQLAWLIMRELEQRLKTGASGIKPCYVACGEHLDPLDQLETHPYLQEYLRKGWFDTALLQTGTTSLQLRAQGGIWSRTANPVAILCLEGFKALPSELYAVHHGKVMEGRVKLNASCDTQGYCSAYSITYEWQSLGEEELARSPWQALFRHCLKCVPSAPFLIPARACDLIDAFATLCGGRYLLLSSDPGNFSEHQLRLARLSPPNAWHQEAPLPPVNYHAISLHQQQRGALIWNRQLRDGGIVVHMAWRDDHYKPEAGAFDALMHEMDSTHPDDVLQLIFSLAASTLPDMATATLSLLRISRHDPGLLEAALPDLLQQLFAPSDAERLEWKAVLERTWSNYFPPRDAVTAFHIDTGLFATRLGHWELAKTIFHTALTLYGDQPSLLCHLANCELATGRFAAVGELVKRALDLEPDNAEAMILHDHMADSWRRWSLIPWHHADTVTDEELTLEPLDAEHAENLLHQYRDPQIGVMASLPEIKTLDQAWEWIEEQRGRHNDLMSYAVLHKSWGFVGIVCMYYFEDSGYFYFWTGTDFQGRGIGKKAARLLFRQAARNGVVDIFTSAYKDNARSRKALAQLGFNDMTVRAQMPDEELLFLHLPLQGGNRSSTDSPARKIRVLCNAIHSPLVFIDETNGE